MLPFHNFLKRLWFWYKNWQWIKHNFFSVKLQCEVLQFIHFTIFPSWQREHWFCFSRQKPRRVHWPEVLFLAESRITVWTLPIVWNAANTSIKANPSKNTFKFLTVCCSILFVFLLFSSKVCHKLNVRHKMNVSLSSWVAINN